MHLPRPRWTQTHELCLSFFRKLVIIIIQAHFHLDVGGIFDWDALERILLDLHFIPVIAIDFIRESVAQLSLHPLLLLLLLRFIYLLVKSGSNSQRGAKQSVVLHLD